MRCRTGAFRTMRERLPFSLLQYAETDHAQRGRDARQDQHDVADARKVADGQRRQADEDAHLILQGLFAQRQFYGEELCYFHLARVETSRPLALVYPRSSYQSAPLKAMLELFRIQVPKLYGL